MNKLSTRDKLLAALTALLIAALAAGISGTADAAVEGHDAAKSLERRLLKAADGVQYPGSESDSTWQFVAYPDEVELPDAARFEEMSGCPVTEEGYTSRFDFDATLDRLTRIEPWMDEGQVKSARSFRKIERIMLRSYGDRAVYRCETGKFGQVYIYFVGTNEAGLSGLLTISTET